MSCLALRLQMEFKGMKDTGRASSLFPAARDKGCSAFQLWPAGLLGWLERRREARVCLLPRVQVFGSWGCMGPRRTSHPTYYLHGAERPASGDGGLLWGLKKQKKGERKKPTYRNKNSMLLISCHHDQKFPFPPFPLKATLSLFHWLSLENLWLGFAYAKSICAAARRGAGTLLSVWKLC